jgi:hypothetical protein
MSEQTVTPDRYPAVLTLKDGLYCFHVGELGVVACDASLEAAHAKLRARLGEMLDEARRADLLDTLPPPAGRATGVGGAPQGTLRVASDLRGFLIKTAVAVVAALVVLLPVGWSVGNALRTAVAGLEIKGGRAFWSTLERQILEAAEPDRAMDPDRQARLVAALSTLAHRAAPFTEALAPAFGAAAAAPAAPPHDGPAEPATDDAP